MMNHSYFTDLLLRKLSAAQVQDLYMDWILGDGTFAKLQARRRVDISPTWRRAELLGGGGYRGRNECRIDTRSARGEFVLQFIHRDGDDAASFWHNVVEIVEEPTGTRLRHGVARSSPPGTSRPIAVRPPGILRELLDRNGAILEPRDVANSILDLPDHHAKDFSDYILRDPDRGLSMLVVTPGAAPLLDCDLLTRNLMGLARVVALTNADATRVLTKALLDRAFDARFVVRDGAARLYLPRLERTDSPFRHRLWIGHRLREMHTEPHERSEVLAREVAQSVLMHALPPGYFSAVERFDRRQQAETTRALLDRASLETTTRDQAQALAALTDRAHELEAAANAQVRQLALLVVSNEQLELEKLELEERVSEVSQQYEEQVSALAQRVDDAEGEVRAKQAVIDHLNDVLVRLKAETTADSVSPEVREALRAALEQTVTIEQGLTVIHALYPDRVVILPTAIRSAKESRTFKEPSRALNLMMLLAGPYWQDLVDGKTDGDARRVFGNGHAATDSETVMSNRRARRLRTFEYAGRPIEMLAHLKIGTKESPAETWRLHYVWLAEEKRIVIGHCGPYLDHS